MILYLFGKTTFCFNKSRKRQVYSKAISLLLLKIRRDVLKKERYAVEIKYLINISFECHLVILLKNMLP